MAEEKNLTPDEMDGEEMTVTLTLDDGKEYDVTLNGESIDAYNRNKGAIEITLDGCIKDGVIKVTAK